ncbi:unnamed protein product [Paramecium sonneborni]|uniref:Photosystem I assembly protein Ycf3 n=1 Tax=Paramecium sonneborni TaxID=65129 RepID=A0A8S1RMN7_9CILI|nr:unnamed protein product [Paramecium sonneborni]
MHLMIFQKLFNKIRYCKSLQQLRYKLITNQIGNVDQKQKQYEQALNEYSRTIQIKSQYNYAHSNRGKQRHKKYDEAISLEPKNPLPLSSLGR